MRNLNLYQKLSLGVIFFMTATLLFLIVHGETSMAVHAPAPTLPADYENFHAEKIVLSKYVGSDTVFTFSVKEMYQRKRVSKLFVYENLKELFFRDVVLEVFTGFEGKPAIPLDDLGGSLKALESSLLPAKDALAENMTDVEMSLVSRVVMDSISLKIHLDNDSHVEITADEAVINSLFDMLIMSGNVRMYSKSRVVSATKAIWTSKHNGLFFPEGYSMNGVKQKEKAFFILHGQSFDEAIEVPAIDYSDVLDRKETDFYNGIAGNLTSMERLVLGIQPVSPEKKGGMLFNGQRD